jgi:ribonucleoside-triphosphate reductase
MVESETSAWRSAQFQIVWLNLPRVGYLAGGSHVRVFEELTRLMEVAAQAHLEKRVFLEKLLALRDRGPLSALAMRAGKTPFLRLNWTTHAIGIVGLNELCRVILQSDLHDSEAAMDFALKVLAHLGREVERLSNKHKVNFLLTGQPAESAPHRLARLDLRFFGRMAAEAVCGDAASGAVYYSDGVKLAHRSQVPVLDRIRTEGLFHQLGINHAVTQVWIDQEVPQPEDVGRLISQAFYQTSCAGLVFCPQFTICSECGGQSRGLRSSCDHCGSAQVDGLVYAAGRHVYTSSLGAGRLAEIRDRCPLRGPMI